MVVVRARAIRGSKHQLLAYELDQLSRPILQASSCLDEEKEERDLEREAPSVTERSYETTSKESRSQPSADWLAEVVSSVSLDSSTKKPEEFLRSSWRT